MRVYGVYDIGSLYSVVLNHDTGDKDKWSSRLRAPSARVWQPSRFITSHIIYAHAQRTYICMSM